MPTITIVLLSAPDHMTVAALDAIRHAPTLFLQTDRHPYAAVVKNAGVLYRAMDDLYEQAEDFDALNRLIAARLTESGTCVYAVTGRIENAQLPAIRAVAKEKGYEVAVLPAVPPSAVAFPDCQTGRVVAAAELTEETQIVLPLTVEEIDSPIRAGQVKLLLSEYVPDEWEILVAETDGDCKVSVRAVPLYELDRLPRYGATTMAYIPPVPFADQQRFGYRDLSDVMRRLRAPNGCPWDREQTHASLRAALLEECYELLDAIDAADDAHILEELGDVLMQVVFHSIIAAEQGRFTERDVTTNVVNKLVYRHPHIFGTVHVDSADEVLVNWDKLKRIEKAQTTHTDVLKSVPRNLPSLTMAYKVQKKAANVGFDWDSAAEALSKIIEEAQELQAAMAGNGDVKEEMGDLLFSVVNVARLLKADPELLLRAATDKFIARFADMEALAAHRGCKLEEMTMSQMDELWENAKKVRNNGK